MSCFLSLAYEDQDDDIRLPPNHMAYCADDLVFTVPLCVPDPPDPTKIPCYNKTQVSNFIIILIKACNKLLLPIFTLM